MKVPGIFWITLLIAAPLVLAPVLMQMFPASAYWWSPLIVAVLTLLALAAKIAWPKASAKVDPNLPSGVQAAPAPEQKQSTISKVIWGA